jgi:competence protein ComEC
VSDATVVVLAIAALVGAWWARPVPLPVLVGVALVGVLAGRRIRPLLGVLLVALTASALGVRAWDGIRDAPTSGHVRARAVVVRDPERVHGAARIELRLDPPSGSGRRVLSIATRSTDAATVLSRALAGERVQVEGRLRPVSTTQASFLARRHIGSVLVVSRARVTSGGSPLARFTNQLRRTLADGTRSMPSGERALFTGLVLGDDRDQSPADVEDFRATGLSHLLAVSGENVAFALAVAAPLLRRLPLRPRLATGLGVLVVFGALTRWEPSVLRAVAMAGISMGAVTLGRPASSVRILALATAGLVLVDPMLAGSIGFLLSVGACAGIAVLAPRLQAKGMPAPLAVTLAAQVGVAPVLVPVFGGVPLVSLPANLLAVPAAGPVMVWGLVAGLPAGLVGGPVAATLHLPTRALLVWIAGVAHVGARLPLPQIGAVGCGIVLVVAAVVVRLRHRLPGIAVAAAVGVAFVAPLALAVARPPPDVADADLAIGARLWRRDGAVVLVLAGNADEGSVLRALREAGVRRVDVLVLRSGGSAAARLAAAVRQREGVRVVIAPPGHHVPGAVAAPAGRSEIGVGTARVEMRSVGGRLEVDIGAPP